jgi:hypothetical protein
VLIDEKILGQKSRDTVPLMKIYFRERTGDYFNMIKVEAIFSVQSDHTDAPYVSTDFRFVFW